MSDNESIWKRVLRAAAPVIGTAWGGPLGGTVATVVSEKILGKPDGTETEIAQAIGNGGPEVLAKLSPDFPALLRSHDSINGVLVTARSETDGYDFHSRYFWPWSGTDEDPVTGGTHTFLAKYWAQRLGKTKMKSYQSSRRSGSMEVELKSGQLEIRGQAVIVLEGRLTALENNKKVQCKIS